MFRPPQCHVFGAQPSPIAFCSGAAACFGAILGFVKSGDHILMVDTVYGPVRTFCGGFLKRFGVETLRDAITKVMDGDVWVPQDTDLSSADDPDMTRLRDRLVTLTPQQVRVLMMLSEGLLNKQIAYNLGVSEATVKAHVSAILQKLNVESRTQAVIAAAKIEVGQWPPAAPQQG